MDGISPSDRPAPDGRSQPGVQDATAAQGQASAGPDMRPEGQQPQAAQPALAQADGPLPDVEPSEAVVLERVADPASPPPAPERPLAVVSPQRLVPGTPEHADWLRRRRAWLNRRRQLEARAGGAAPPPPVQPALQATAEPALPPPQLAPPAPRPKAAPWRLIAFLLALVLPTIGAAVYAYGVAADLYVSETRFLVRGQGQSSAGGGGVLAMFSGGSLAAHPLEALAVQDYMASQDAVAALEDEIDLRAIYTRPEADWLARLEDEASPEELLDFHRHMISARIDSLSGIVTLRTFGWRPDDAHGLAERLLTLGERLVNRMNDRLQEDALRVARSEVELAETRVAEVRDALTRFRELERQIDPTQASTALLGIITTLEAQLVQVKAEMTEVASYTRADNPRLVNLRARATALERQIAAERAKLTGEAARRDGTFAQMIAEYEKLQMRREFADSGLASALSSLEQARLDASRQRLFLVRVVQPNLPIEALYPRRWLIVLGTAGVALLTFGIGALLVAGVRDHLE